MRRIRDLLLPKGASGSRNRSKRRRLLEKRHLWNGALARRVKCRGALASFCELLGAQLSFEVGQISLAAPVADESGDRNPHIGGLGILRHAATGHVEKA